MVAPSELEHIDGLRNAGMLPTNSRSNVYEKSRVVKSGEGILVGFTVYNSGAAQFIQWHDSAVVPAAGAVPEGVITIGATSDRELMWAAGEIKGRTFDRGIVLVNSSTGPTYTAGAADCFFDAQYI